MGETVGPILAQIDLEKVRAFRESVGDSGVQDIPPTFLTAYRECEFTLLRKVGIPLSKVLHAEQEYSFSKPLQVGEKIAYLTRVANVLEKRGSNSLLIFLVIETDFYSGEKIDNAFKLAFSKTTIVVRETFDGKKPTR